MHVGLAWNITPYNGIILMMALRWFIETKMDRIKSPCTCEVVVVPTVKIGQPIWLDINNHI